MKLCRNCPLVVYYVQMWYISSNRRTKLLWLFNDVGNEAREREKECEVKVYIARSSALRLLKVVNSSGAGTSDRAGKINNILKKQLIIQRQKRIRASIVVAAQRKKRTSMESNILNERRHTLVYTERREQIVWHYNKTNAREKKKRIQSFTADYLIFINWLRVYM